MLKFWIPAFPLFLFPVLAVNLQPDAQLPLTLLDSPCTTPACNLTIALSTLQTSFFSEEKGTWPTAIDWTSAFIGDLLASTVRTLQPTHPDLADRYYSHLSLFYDGQNDAALRFQAFDDMLWVVLNWLSGIRASTNPDDIGVWGSRALTFYELAAQGWTTDLCGGGMLWSPYLVPYKNAITNELFITASVWMYLYHPSHDTKFLANAIMAHRWLKNSGMKDRNGYWTDGFHVKDLEYGGTECNERNDMLYTYNQAVMLSGLRALADVTGNQEYIREGVELVQTTMSGYELVWGGLLTEKCDPGGYCSQNGQMFKAIWMHHVASFCQSPREPKECHDWKDWISTNAEAAWKTRDRHGVAGPWWGVEAGVLSSPIQGMDKRKGVDVANECGWKEDVRQCEVSQRSGRKKGHKGDLNDRGRGRTVESHAGLVSALRALVELS